MRKEENYFDNIDELFTQAFELEDNNLIDSLQFEGENFVDYEHYSEGGIKEIFLCRDRRTNRRVAMAVLKDTADTKKTEAFLREAKINAALQHPNIVPIYEMGIDEKKPWFAMKFIAGSSLAEIIEDLNAESPARLADLSQRLDVFNKVCDAIAYAHSLGVLHLDIKPDNIRISNYGDVVVCDWGLADIEATICDEQLLEYCTILEYDLDHQTLDGTVKGTPGYMAPEQTSIVKIRKGRHTDIFALGTLLYSLLTLEKPFKGDSLENILSNTAKGNFIKPSTLKADLPASLEAICLKAMQVKPEDRYLSVEALQKDLEAYRNGFATYAEKASILKLLKLLIYRHKMLFSLACLLFFLIPISTLFLLRNMELSKTNIEQENEKLLLEQEIHRQRGKDSAPLFLERAQENLKIFDYDTSLRFCNEALERDQEMLAAWKLKAYLHFIKEEYQNCLDAFTKAGVKNGRIIALAKNSLLLEQISEPKEKLQQRMDQLTRLHSQKDMKTFSFFMHNIVHNDLPLVDRLKLCRYIIGLRNKRADNEVFNFRYDSKSRTLDISNNPWIKIAHCLQNFPADTIIASNTSIRHGGNFYNKHLINLDISNTDVMELRTLKCQNLKNLKISGTIIHDLSPLEEYALVSLDISHTPIRYLNFVPKTPSLKQLYIHQGQFQKQQFKWLRKDIEVITK
ncbi:serine/threonine-protein kinase [Lentisphaera profundi]|uniref:Serine/threonine-protein kinase n=1 Tax=Lentisphaera profundi TaxID=1658616 RepID=A0ABY7VSG3_9BACT|nr:serine/threonine-protein kinase [Lentisphaera profundi]WDE97146.1 serine/threonine-protein kinase [Lentisphaera profundi]